MNDTMTARWLDSDQQAHWRAFLSGTTRLFERLDRQLRERSGISLAEYEILVRLSEAPGQHLRMAELASSLAHSRSRITHTVARLEAAGAVIRQACPSDGRGVLALLTDGGMRMLVDAAPGHVDAVRGYLVDVASPADFEAVGRVFGATADLLADDS
ncbi:MAG: MarR family transcriptional regulator [Actinomycetota bacterium]|nr:MarR family transcriptional regulator [Actinomycetota bacterium]